MRRPDRSEEQAARRAVVLARRSLAALVALVLRHCTIESEIASTAAQADAAIERGPADLVVVELARPHAMELLGRSAAPPTLAIVDPERGGSSFDAFRRGADQVVRIAFTPDEFAVRAAALLRRTGPPVSFRRNEPIDGIELSLDEYARIGGRRVTLGVTLNSLLYVAVANLGHVTSRGDIRALTWGIDRAASDATVDRVVRRLARAIAPQSALGFTIAAGGVLVRGRSS